MPGVRRIVKMARSSSKMVENVKLEPMSIQNFMERSKMHRLKIAGVLATVVFASLFVFSGETQAQVAGNWRGSWISHTNGHHGNLNAKIRQVDCNHYRAVFRGTFFKVIPFRYSAKLQVVEQQPGYTRLSGSQRLGPIMGDFGYEAIVTGIQFQATFHSKKDHGVWQMQRQ